MWILTGLTLEGDGTICISITRRLLLYNTDHISNKDTHYGVRRNSGTQRGKNRKLGYQSYNEDKGNVLQAPGGIEKVCIGFDSGGCKGHGQFRSRPYALEGVTDGILTAPFIHICMPAVTGATGVSFSSNMNDSW